MPDAFIKQDKTRVPLVWQHGHDNPENVLGHVLLENRDDGVYAYAFFNDSDQANHAKKLVAHGDINSLSIWANKLIERSKRVMHGVIREVSLVLSGANPGALIDSITIAHSDGTLDNLEDEAIIFTGLELEHGGTAPDEGIDEMEDELEFAHADGSAPPAGATVKDVYDSMTKEQQDVLHFLVGEAIQATTDELGGASVQQDGMDDESISHDDTNNEGETVMGNVFDQSIDKSTYKLSHDDMKEIVADAGRRGSLKAAVEAYAQDHLEHGIQDIEVLFPDATNYSDTPEFKSRRMEWVNNVLGGASKRPFAKIRTRAADITWEEARAKGYVKGNLKREEFFGVTKRETTPQTVYKKQKLDRDDIIDITDFDVVMWLKSEMRVMLDEEIARAALIGDGRDVAHDDKISETHIRPIATDHDLFVTTVTVNLDDANSNIQELVDAIVTNRQYYKGSGLPTLYTSETIISRFLLLKDAVGRRIYNSLDELASELRVAGVVPVEAMEEEPEVVGILVNMVDYVFGTDKGGEVNLFDDFDIDYNQYKYLLETRCSGALVRLKSAIVLRKSGASDVAVVPTPPTYDSETGEITITNTTGVVYTNTEDDTVMNAAGSPYEVPAGDTITVVATADTGYYIASTANTSWTFFMPPA